LEEIKEMVSMTRLGQMIYDDGKAGGKIEGKIEGETIKLVKQVCKKLAKDKTPEEIAYDLEEEPAEIKKYVKQLLDMLRIMTMSVFMSR